MIIGTPIHFFGGDQRDSDTCPGSSREGREESDGVDWEYTSRIDQEYG